MKLESFSNFILTNIILMTLNDLIIKSYNATVRYKTKMKTVMKNVQGY